MCSKKASVPDRNVSIVSRALTLLTNLNIEFLSVASTLFYLVTIIICSGFIIKQRGWHHAMDQVIKPLQKSLKNIFKEYLYLQYIG
jgi:hypothetical protein